MLASNVALSEARATKRWDGSVSRNLAMSGAAALSPSWGPRRNPVLSVTVAGEEFSFQKPFIMMHAEKIKQMLLQDPALDILDLPGSSASFGRFAAFLQGSDGPAGEVTSENVLDLLHWARELDVRHIPALCEEFLLLRPPPEFPATQLLELASSYGMPLVYARYMETAAQQMPAIAVPEVNEAATYAPAFGAKEIRDEMVRTHISMGLMRNDGEGRCHLRFADYTGLPDERQRSRLYWKSRPRFVPAPKPQPVPDWRSLQLCWPHHSLRGEDWSVVPAETQPAMPMRRRPVHAGAASCS
eukprot:TRINITY_DN25865_c0_g1_i6.p1 TRINITY_DN25865_c0_g1~~TRINITY_DN25865_c0_g1_i6.p1  ORF type:complete len:300 (-),score=35.22 TRINITY_DN25865_c0_g1_i6:65-964(-)